MTPEEIDAAQVLIAFTACSMFGGSNSERVIVDVRHMLRSYAREHEAWRGEKPITELVLGWNNSRWVYAVAVLETLDAVEAKWYAQGGGPAPMAKIKLNERGAELAETVHRWATGIEDEQNRRLWEKTP